MTVAEAFSTHYLKYQAELAPRTRGKISQQIKRWEKFTANPGVESIRQTTFTDFRSKLLDAGLAPATINSNIATVIAILRHLGPKNAGFPHALGLLSDVPYHGKPLKENGEPREPATLAQLGACYHACRVATWPGRDACAWWRAWLVTAYNTGLRREDLLAIERASINETWAWFTIRAQKTGKLHYLPIHPVVRRHWQTLPVAKLVLATRTDGASTIAWTRFYNELRVIAASARVDMPTPQSIRRLAALQFELAHPGAGSILLGHRDVTTRHYVAALHPLTSAAEKIPQIPGSDDHQQLRLFA